MGWGPLVLYKNSRSWSVPEPKNNSCPVPKKRDRPLHIQPQHQRRTAALIFEFFRAVFWQTQARDGSGGFQNVIHSFTAAFDGRGDVALMQQFAKLVAGFGLHTRAGFAVLGFQFTESRGQPWSWLTGFPPQPSAMKWRSRTWKPGAKAWPRESRRTLPAGVLMEGPCRIPACGSKIIFDRELQFPWRFL